MKNQTSFQVSQGTIFADCLPETREFIDQNLQFFHSVMTNVAQALKSEGAMTFVSNEEAWNFSCSIEKTELGRVVRAEGTLIDGGSAKFDEVLEELALRTDSE